jgi:hypothetical protein
MQRDVEMAFKRKLSDAQVAEITSRYAAGYGEDADELAAEF